MIRLDRRKTFVALTIMVAVTIFVAASLSRALNPALFARLDDATLVISLVTLWLSALVAVGFIGGHIVNLIRPPRLVLRREGLVLEGWRRTSRLAWNDIEAIRAGYDRRRHRGFVGFVYRSGAEPKGVEQGTLDQTIGFGWPGHPEDLARELEDWRIRHSV